MKVAIVHYWLFHMRGGEKVLEALCELYPDADIFTHVYNAKGVSKTISRHKVTETFIAKLPFARKKYQLYLPLMPLALEELDLTAYDLVISSEAGPAKGVITRPDAVHICYCHSPMRYAWDQYHVYINRASWLRRLFAPVMLHWLRVWDYASAARVDHFIANSSIVAKRIEKYYRRPAQIIFPPVDTEAFAPVAEIDDFYLYVGQMVRYKRVDIAIEACRKLGRRLVIIGDGEERKDLEKAARGKGSKVQFLGKADYETLKAHYAKCRALLFPGEEDFGIVPVEAMASGRPVIAFNRGGAKDSLIENETGVFFEEQTPEALAEAILKFEAGPGMDPAAAVARAQVFRKARFKAEFAQAAAAALAQNGR